VKCQKVCFLTSDMVNKVIHIVREDDKKGDKELAVQIKKEFDLNFFPTWHCIVGKDFGSEIEYEENHMIYFYIGSKAILLFRAG